jgi:hypothetical protein
MSCLTIIAKQGSPGTEVKQWLLVAVVKHKQTQSTQAFIRIPLWFLLFSSSLWEPDLS